MGNRRSPRAHFLGGAGQRQGRDVAFGGHHLAAADVVGVDAEDFLGLRIDVDLALAEDAIGRLAVGELAAGVDAVAGAADDPLGVAGDDVRRAGEGLLVIDDAVGQQEAVDLVQRDGRDGLGDRRAADLRRQLDGPARFATVQHQARLAIDVDQAEGVAGVDQVGILDLRVGVPEFRPLPWLAEEFPRDVPQGIAPDHRVAVRMPFPEVDLGLRQTARGKEQKGD